MSVVAHVASTRRLPSRSSMCPETTDLRPLTSTRYVFITMNYDNVALENADARRKR
jgi:hypothetical protein